MKALIWLDALAFAVGSAASAWGLIAWDAGQQAPLPSMHARYQEDLAFAVVASVWGGVVYLVAQASRQQAQVLRRRPASPQISFFLGVAFVALWVIGGRALDFALGIFGRIAIACLAPWALSRVVWRRKDRDHRTKDRRSKALRRVLVVGAALSALITLVAVLRSLQPSQSRVAEDVQRCFPGCELGPVQRRGGFFPTVEMNAPVSCGVWDVPLLQIYHYRWEGGHWHTVASNPPCRDSGE